jgi:hypothetical protein
MVYFVGGIDNDGFERRGGAVAIHSVLSRLD